MIAMRKAFLAVVVAVAASLAALSAIAAPQETPPAKTLKVSIPAKTPLFAPYFIALDKKYYAAEGLDVKLVEAPGGVATPALLSGTIDVSTSSASAVSAAIRGAHIKIVYTMADRLPDQLWASRPAYKTLKDLKGLTVGIASRGDTYEIAMRSALEAAGLPQSWVGYTPLGFAVSARLAALISGSLPAVMLTPTSMGTARTDGSLKQSHMMIDFSKTLQLPYTGAAVSDKLLKTDPKAVEGFLRATIRGVRYALAFEPETLAILQKHNPQTDKKVLLEGYRDTVPTMTKVGTVSDELIKTDLKVRATILNIDPGRVPPINAIYDYALTRKVTAQIDASGWKPTP